ncbi:MAG: DUF448 domain-containing protein [Alphaproteobacteria bacterium]|nr:MAG: DUF448 domain-containing protein [Alphaproteobacteria bacterium]
MAAGADRADARPIRRCILTGARTGAEDLIRLVATPDGVLGADIDAKLPGRGAWVCADKGVLATAIAKGALAAKAARALRHEGPLAVPADFAAQIDARLCARVLDRLGLERRAGRLVAGFEKTEALLAAGKAVLAIHASDAGADGVAKLTRLAAAQGVPQLALFDRAQLSLALGRENVVHAALKAGAAVDRLLAAAARLARFRAGAAAGAGAGQRR